MFNYNASLSKHSNSFLALFPLRIEQFVFFFFNIPLLSFCLVRLCRSRISQKHILYAKEAFISYIYFAFCSFYTKRKFSFSFASSYSFNILIFTYIHIILYFILFTHFTIFDHYMSECGPSYKFLL